ncbi:uncharacterized protein AB675_2231, partial [Cyphellophora attinorum]
MSLNSFLDEIYKSLQSKDGQRIADLIHLDVESLPPQRQQPYVQLNAELQKQYPANNDAALLQQCKARISQEEFGTFSTPFCDSIARYFRYLRDIQTADNLTKALAIRQLTSQCVTALGDSRYGIVMIPIVLSFSRTLASIATKLDRNPTLIRQHAQKLGAGNTDSSTPRTSFVEDAANVLRDAFIKCLAGSPGTARTSRPQADDKRIGIYLTANSTLKLLFRCLKQRNAQQIFSSIDAQSPPLSFYPAAQRVTYLYYLGRYHFANNHFLRASAALNAAYIQCHKSATSHLRLILTYLLASNLRHRTFHAILSLPSPLNNNQPPNPIAAFLLRHRIHLQLLNRLEPLVYRSLIKRTFRLVGFPGGTGADKKIPFLRLAYVRAAARFSFTRAPIAPGTLPHTAPLDSDFWDLENALAETGFDIGSGIYDSSNTTTTALAVQANPFSPPNSEEEQSPTMAEIESVFLSLIQQGFLKGFVLHVNPRFAIPGAAQRGGWAKAGFPVGVWGDSGAGRGGEAGWIGGCEDAG